MISGIDRKKSLQELENSDWGDPESGETSMIARCLRLRRTPLEQLSTDDLRLMIGQKISPPYLVPLCLDRMELDPLLEATYFRGDLLKALLQLDEKFWKGHRDSLSAVRELIAQAKEAAANNDEDARSVVEAVPAFLCEPDNTNGSV